MTRIENVSIGKYAFNVDVNALNLIEDYLNALESHYAGMESGREILDEIENRLAELLLERCPTGVVVGKEDAKTAIEILGKPEMIEEESSTQADGTYIRQKAGKPKKRLYRDVDNKVFGGVCSGLANYFNFDMVAMRIIWAGMLILTGCIPWTDNISGFIVLAYLVLWLSMPAANSIQKRAQMNGRDLGIGSIQAEHEYVTRSRRGNGLAKGVTIGFGTLFILIALVGSSAIILTHLGLTNGQLSFLSSALTDWMDFNGNTITTSFKVATVFLYIVICMPWVGLLYLGILLTFGLKEPRWRPGLIMFLIWLISISGFAVSAAQTFFTYFF